MRFFLLMGFLMLIGSSCEKSLPAGPAESEVLDGPLSNLTASEQLQFVRGDEAFGEVFTIEKGLGPIFVANQCSGCHPGDGKGSPFVGFLRFGQSDTTGNHYLHLGGPQIQHKAIPGFLPEKLPAGVASTRLLAPAVTGLGFLDAVPDSELLKLADPTDVDQDGISGRPHWNVIPDYVQLRPDAESRRGRYITRFGKKGAVYDLLQQTANAYKEDMGITSLFEPMDPFSKQEVDPEVGGETIHDVVFYLKTLKAPIPRNQEDDEVDAGRMVFSEIGCDGCHTPTLRTGHSPIGALSQVEFYPYTDLLLHDMGPLLDDGYTEGFALSSEWRTPPLWGLGLSRDAQGGRYFLLHDGRAATIEDAILLHGGEAERVTERYRQLGETEKRNLITFLESL
ncbi:MAG: thiol oxidoreductase [Saprospiraceae bacterium]|nr:thiol oxidoreductase [Saprospiraceae bacterium]